MKRYQLIYLLLFSFLFVACGKEESTIPSRPVSIKLDLRYEDKDLKNMGSYKTITTQTTAHPYIGFGGVLVLHAQDNNYYAFDLSCPYEAKSSVKIAVDEDALYAVCPKCSTKYDISMGVGSPLGIGTSYLRRYTVSATSGGDILIVSN